MNISKSSERFVNVNCLSWFSYLYEQFNICDTYHHYILNCFQCCVVLNINFTIWSFSLNHSDTVIFFNTFYFLISGTSDIRLPRIFQTRELEWMGMISIIVPPIMCSRDLCTNAICNNFDFKFGSGH